MNIRHPMGVLHSFSIKNIFYDKMDLRLFRFDMAISLKGNHVSIHTENIKTFAMKHS